MFAEMIAEKREFQNRIKYEKSLGWSEFNEEGDKRPAEVIVLDVVVGYNVFRRGEELRFIGWFKEMDAAVEAGVDYARKEIADHEIKQQKKERV